MTGLVSSSTFVQHPTNSAAHRGRFHHNCFPQKPLKKQETRAAQFVHEGVQEADTD